MTGPASLAVLVPQLVTICLRLLDLPCMSGARRPNQPRTVRNQAHEDNQGGGLPIGAISMRAT